MNRLKLAVALALGVLATDARAVVYNPTADFQSVNNPSGVWSYGYSLLGGPSYAMNLFDVGGIDGNNVAAWSSSVVNDSGVPAVLKNNSLSTLNGVAPGQISLHPGAQAFAILRFTAPNSGLYDIAGQFFAGDSGSESGSLVVNAAQGSPLVSFSDTTNQSSFAVVGLALAGGETLDFVVGVTGSYFHGNTPLEATITGGAAAVREPASMAFLLGGLAVLGAVYPRRTPRPTARLRGPAVP